MRSTPGPDGLLAPAAKGPITNSPGSKALPTCAHDLLVLSAPDPFLKLMLVYSTSI